MRMSQVGGSRTWREEIASFVEDSDVQYKRNSLSIASIDSKGSQFNSVSSNETQKVEPENLTDQVKGFVKAWGELLVDLYRGCRDIVHQSLVTDDSYIVQKFGRPVAKVSGKLRFLNEYLPEDRDPILAWPVIFFVFILALFALNVNSSHDNSVVKKIQIHPPSATLLLLPDGRHIAYHERGVPANKARYTIISPHAFLSSRLSGGIPGVRESLLEEFHIRLLTYDLPGFGESDPHPTRTLNSSASDMLYLADTLGVSGRFWLLGFSSANLHVWAALRYISDRVAGVAMFAPMVNPYDPSMTKEETSKIWGVCGRKRRLMFFLAKRFPSFLSYLYRGSFLSGSHSQFEKFMSVSLVEKDKAKIEGKNFQKYWHRDVEESVRQGSAKPFIEEAMLLVSDWGFSIADLQMKNKCPGNGILPWLKSIYSKAECRLTGFAGPIHIWQGLDDQVVPPSMAEYVSRILPQTVLHSLPNEGHFSYFFFCDECHREILLTLFGYPEGRSINQQLQR
ncbi:hypothetical protein Dimus_007189 [Dionaea muscipula]